MFGMVPVSTTTGIHHPQSHLMMPQVSVIKHEPMDSSPSIITRVTADLYLCDSVNGISYPLIFHILLLLFHL